MLYPFITYKDKTYMNNPVRSEGATSHQPRAEHSDTLGIMRQTNYALKRAKAFAPYGAIGLFIRLPRVPLKLCPGLIGVSLSGYNFTGQ